MNLDREQEKSVRKDPKSIVVSFSIEIMKAEKKYRTFIKSWNRSLTCLMIATFVGFAITLRCHTTATYRLVFLIVKCDTMLLHRGWYAHAQSRYSEAVRQ